MKIYETLETQLKKENDFINDEGELKKWVVINRAQSADETLISLLLNHEELKERFFAKIKDALVFRQNDFVRFMEQKNFLNDSFTAYRNKVGLTIDDKLMSQRNEVALVWPFKDCVLEGGQSHEEEKRDEIFFNEVLAQDEITQLLEPKVLTEAKVYDADGEKAFAGFTRDAAANKARGLSEDSITDNLIIKGNNLLALHSLEREFSGKIKLIYIDPPYNTGNDSFKYNDKFSRSTWLTFMRNRLQIARKLLTKDGVVFVQCDDNEHAYLKILMDDIFGSEKFVNSIAVKMSEATGVKMSHARMRFPKLKEYLLFYEKDQFSGFSIIDKYKHPVWDSENNIFLENLTKDAREEMASYEVKEDCDDKDAELVCGLLEGVKKVSLAKKIKDMDFSSAEEELDWKFQNSYRIIKTAGAGSLAKIVKSKEDIPEQDIAADISSRGILFLYLTDFNRSTKDPRFRVIFADTNIYKHPCDFWQDIKTSGAISDEGGVKLEKGKKPEKILHRIIRMVTNPSDIVLDYHLGSGTSCAVAHKMRRQYIGIEQLDYGKNDSVERLKNVISGDLTGISQDEDWSGGGSFTYIELKKHNQDFIDEIEGASDSTALLKIWQDMKEKSFLNYNIDMKRQEEHLDDFKALELEGQKAHLVSLLDKNQLYVNLSSLEDSDFECSKADKQVTRDFYRLDS